MSESSIRDVVIILYLHELAKTSLQVTLMEQQEIKRGDLTGTGGGYCPQSLRSFGCVGCTYNI